MPVLTVSIDIETLGHEPHHYHLMAIPHEREEVAKRLSLLSLDKLEADVHLLQKGRIHLTGKIIADVIQECVRTLQPLPQHLEINVDEFFTLTPVENDEEVMSSEEGVDEVLDGPILDVGEIVIQLLSLNLDPFPVAPSSTPLEYKEDLEPSSPFEILKKR